MKFILAKKLGMTQVWKDDKVVAVTRLQAGPCLVSQIKTEEKDGYKAVQIGFEEKKEKNIAKPQKGHNKGLKNFKYVKEFRLDDNTEVKRGDKVLADTFEEGDKIDAISVSKGKGFQGVVKRHGFGGSKKTHGNKDQLRMPGSIGATGPAHVFKGVRMGGRMGGDRTTLKNLEIIEINLQDNTILVKGGLAGARNSLVMLCGEGELKVNENILDNKSDKKEEKEKIEIKEEKKEESKPVENSEEKEAK